MVLPSVQPVSAIDDRLVALRAAGFHFAANHDADGAIVALIGVRAHRGVVDIVRIWGEDDADAARVPDDESNVLSPDTVLWRASGPTARVLDDLLILPAPDDV
jgi:hypothetical protein